jgi:glycosyltransferase involved in cell wall biosynthesis
MSKILLVFDSHPVQYRVPVWQAIELIQPSVIHVVYATDCSIKGHTDKGFGIPIVWDQPLLEGYSYTILNTENGKPFSGWKSLTGKGVRNIIERIQPDVILLTGFNYKYDWVAFNCARRKKIPLWLRCETQDEASHRSKLKALVRSLIYRVFYRRINKIFYIGNLNRQHYIKHRVKPSSLLPAKYCTPNRFKGMTDLQKLDLRLFARNNAQVNDSTILIGFSGKLIPKKNPGILFDMLPQLSEELRSKIFLYFIGSGELEHQISKQAENALTKYGVKTHFTGFVNQSEIASHYLAMDILVLPSRRMGETWGLVANEAMQAGCSVIVSDAVGCSADFKNWERFAVFPEGNIGALAEWVVKFAKLERNFNWAGLLLEDYSVEASALSLVKSLNN